MALFGVGRRAVHGKEAVPGPALVQPRRSLDGWTLEGTPLADRFGREELRELGTLLHGVGAEMRTAWTYERAADLLERAGERPQALAVVEAWFALPDDARRADAAATRSLGRRRQRLRSRLGAQNTAAVSAASADRGTPAEPAAIPAEPMRPTAPAPTAAIPAQARAVTVPAKPQTAPPVPQDPKPRKATR